MTFRNEGQLQGFLLTLAFSPQLVRNAAEKLLRLGSKIGNTFLAGTWPGPCGAGRLLLFLQMFTLLDPVRAGATAAVYL